MTSKRPDLRLLLVLWEGRQMNYWSINAGEALVALVVMGAIILYFG